MNNQWGSNQYQQGLPGQGNQVQMFDPTKFQAPTSYSGVQASKPRLHARQQNTTTQFMQQNVGIPNAQPNAAASTQQFYSDPSSQQFVGARSVQQAAATQNVQHGSSVQDGSSWRSWGSWEFNQEPSNPQLGNQLQPNQVQQQPGSAIFLQQEPSKSSAENNQFYGDGNYSNILNQGWYASGQYSQQDFRQPESGALYQSQEAQQQHLQQSKQWDQQQYTELAYNQGQHGGSAVDQVQYGTNDQVQYSSNVESTVHQQNSQTNISDQFYQYHPQHSSDQGQVYNQGFGQHKNQTNYPQSNLYAAGTLGVTAESGQWGVDSHQQASSTLDSNNEQHLNNFQTNTSENLPPQSSQNMYTGQNQVTSVTKPNFDVYNADDDGTVSGFFSRDDDGDIQFDSQRYGQNYSGGGSGDQESNLSSGLNQFLAVSSQFHRTDSEISNASLSTINLSYNEDDNKKKQEQKLEENDLTKQQTQEHNRNIFFPSPEDSSGTQQHPNQDVSKGLLQKQAREDYSDFSIGAYPLHNLPLNTNMLPAADGDQPDSGGSGGSGGSSGLADWEIIPSQTGSASLDNNSSLVNTANYFDRPDGGVSLPNNYRNVELSGNPPQDSQVHVSSKTKSDENLVLGLRNLNQTQHTLSHESRATFDSAPPSNKTVEQSGNLLTAAMPFTDSQQKNIIPTTSSTSSQGPAGAQHINTSSSSSQPNVKENEPRLDDITTATRHATTFNPNSGQPAFNDSLRETWNNDRRTHVSSQHGLDLDKQRDVTSASLSKQILPDSSEDGSRNKTYDANQNIFTDAKQSKSVSQPHPEQPRLSSQQQPRHHSAFQPVGRLQQSTRSQTSLVESSEAPTFNILLAPVMPLIIPALNPYSASAAAIAPQSSAAEVSTPKSVVESNEITELLKKPLPSQAQGKENEQKTQEHRGKEQRRIEDNNKSLDSLDEIDAAVDERRNKSYQNQHCLSREPNYYPGHDRQGVDRQDSERPTSRNHRPRNENDCVDHYYDSQYGRKEAYSKEDPYRKPHDYYKDYPDSSYADDRYGRPRSRQDEYRGSRPSSRSTQDASRPRSRADYDQERDYYNRAKQWGYNYDSYARNSGYYNDERERYYRYQREKEARYTRAYYEEYYGAKYAAEYYKQLQHYQQQQQVQRHHQNYSGRASSQELDQSSSRSQSRGSTPAIANSPAITSASPGPDYYANRDTSSAGQTDYGRDHYSRGYSYDGYNAYYDGHGYDPYGYGYAIQGYPDYNQGRMTPPKYTYPHIRASFGPGGQLVKALANRPKEGQPAILDILDIQMVLENFPEAEELRKFPGPLTPNTHKKDVLLFCQQKARACAEDIEMVDRESAQLIWKFLELLIKQNGSVVGTDLADLLLEGHEPSTHEYSLHGMKISQSPEALDTVPEVNSEDNSSTGGSPAVRFSSDRTVINSATESERERCVDRFRHLLLYGRKKDALECAMKSNLWGHALFLASKMDTRTHANVMTRFANSAIRMNDPLQTLYQLMSGRQPAAVTCIVDERWGDWRPHLAMILSNQSSRQDIDCKSITTLGDTLATKSCLHASHFCYLMGQVNFGSYFKKTSKIVLIGSSHNLAMEKFATNEAIQCTEVYEYAQKLGNSAFCLPHLQIYKYIYACRLTDYGMVQEALHYCEVIANSILLNPTWFQASFARLVSQLSEKLHYLDPQSSGIDGANLLWMQHLESLCGAYADGSIQSLSGDMTPVSFPAATANNSENSAYGPVGHSAGGDSVIPNSGPATYDASVYGEQIQAYPTPSVGQDVSGVTGQIQNWGEAVNHQGYVQQSYTQQGYDNQTQQGYSNQPQQYEYGQWPSEYKSYSDTQIHSQGFGGYQMDQQLPPRASISTAEDSDDDDDEDNDDINDDDLVDGNPGGFDYFGNVSSQKVVAPPHRYRSMSGSSAGSTRRRRTTSGSSTGSIKVSPQKTASQQQATNAKGSNKGGQHDNGGSGWFGGLFNKFKTKDKKEMILPDDKNPPIVWDPVKNKWTNADGTEDEITTKVPPPKDTDLLNKPQTSAFTSMAPPSSSLADGNKFSLKAKGAKNQYVDVNNPKLASVPQSLFNVGPGNDGVLVTNNYPTSLVQPGFGQAPDTNSIMAGNVGSYESGQHSTNHVTETPSIPSVSHQPSSMPVLFNPAILKSGSTGPGSASSASSAAGPGLKYGQRRAYPK